MATRRTHKRLTAQAKYQRKLTAMGFKGGRVPTCYVTCLEYNKKWNKEHPERIRAAGKRYDDELSRICGSHDRRHPKVRVELARRALLREAWRKEIAQNGYCSFTEYRRLCN